MQKQNFYNERIMFHLLVKILVNSLLMKLANNDDDKRISHTPYNVDHIEVTRIIQGGLEPNRISALKGKTT